MPEITLPITSLLAAALSLLLVVLSFSITLKRGSLIMKNGNNEIYLFGDGGSRDLRHRVRAHGNFIEIAPMILILVGLMEYAGASQTLLLWLSGIFFLGRVLHALRFYLRKQMLGVFSIMSQHLICLGAAVWLLQHHYL